MSRILVKFPTRERPEKSYEVLKKYIELADMDNIYLVSYDNNDVKMNNPETLEKFHALHTGVICVGGYSKNKVQAYNRDIHRITEWDIIVVASDDMHCVKAGWDSIIDKAMSIEFPDLDGVLHFNDGFTGQKLNTLPILTHKYFDRFGYVYNPAYNSLWCDNHFMKVAEKLGKQRYFSLTLFKHLHFSNCSEIKPDNLMKRTESFYWIDKKIYDGFEKRNFDL